MRFYSPAVRALAAEAASQACAAVAASRAEQFSGTFNEADHPRADDGKFGGKFGGKAVSGKAVNKRKAVKPKRNGDAYRHGDSSASNGELFQHAGVQKVLGLLERTDEVESLLSSDDPEDHKKAGKLLLAARHVAIDEDARTYSHLKDVPARKRAAGKLNPN